MLNLLIYFAVWLVRIYDIKVRIGQQWNGFIILNFNETFNVDIPTVNILANGILIPIFRYFWLFLPIFWFFLFIYRTNRFTMSDICFFTDILILDNPLSPFPPFLCKLHSFYLTNWVPGFTSFFFQLVLPWPASSVVRSVIRSHEWNRRGSLGVQTLRAPSVFKKLSPQV